MVVDYSTNPDQTLIIETRLMNNSKSSIYDFSYEVSAIHNATSLNLDTKGHFYWDHKGYSIGHHTDYKRSYLPLQTAEVQAQVNLIQNWMELKVCKNYFKQLTIYKTIKQA